MQYRVIFSRVERLQNFFNNIPDSKIRGANIGPIWGRQDPGGPHVGPMNFALGDVYRFTVFMWATLFCRFVEVNILLMTSDLTFKVETI